MTEQKKRGFAAMSQAQRSEIASMGGRTAHKMGLAHRFSSAEAAEAGRKGAAARKLKKIGRSVQA